MTAECLGETGMSLKDQTDHRHGKGHGGGGVTRRDHTHKEESHNWKMFEWVKGLIPYFNSFFHCSCSPKSQIHNKVR